MATDNVPSNTPILKRDLTGQKFNRLLVLSFSAMKGNTKKKAHYICRCDCGTVKEVQGSKLTGDLTKSCGCWNRERSVIDNTTHGMSGGRLYNCWQHMRIRCSQDTCSNWKDYGGRGIRVCQEWHDSFIVFKDWALSSGYAPDLFIDRRDNDGNYTPENCRWVTRAVNNRNKRSNIYIEYRGKVQTAKDWSEELEIPYWTIKNRIKYGCDPLSAILYGKEKMPSGAPRRHPGID